MQLGMIGLGRMGGNIVRRLFRHGHSSVVLDQRTDAVTHLAGEGAISRCRRVRSRVSAFRSRAAGPHGRTGGYVMTKDARQLGAVDKLPAVIIVMGVSGSGKGTIGLMLAHRLDWEIHGCRLAASGRQCREDAPWIASHR